MGRNRWSEGYLLIDAVVGVLILAMALSAFSGLFSRQVKRVNTKIETARAYLMDRNAYIDELKYEYK